MSKPVAGSALVWQAESRWKAPDGKEVTGQVPVPYGIRAGATITVWTERDGDLTTAPLTSPQVSDQAELGGVAGVIAAAAVLALTGALARRALDKRRLAAWDADWAAGPHWTKRA